MKPDTRYGNTGSGLRTDASEPQYTGVRILIGSCEDVFGVETIYFLSHTLQSKHESQTSQKESAQLQQTLLVLILLQMIKISENHVPKNGACNLCCSRPWKHALLARPPLACHRLWGLGCPTQVRRK